MTEFSDFETPPGQAESKKSFPTILWIIGGLGCGCFGTHHNFGNYWCDRFAQSSHPSHKAREAEARITLIQWLEGSKLSYRERNF
jgi:hypothetical protein